MKKLYFYFQVALFCCTFLFVGNANAQRVLESNQDGLWSNGDIWTCISCIPNETPATPTNGDQIIIRSDDEVIIDDTFSYAVGSPIRIDIYGQLNFEESFSFLILSVNSTINLSPDASINFIYDTSTLLEYEPLFQGIVIFQEDQFGNPIETYVHLGDNGLAGFVLNTLGITANFIEDGVIIEGAISLPSGGLGPLPVTLTSFSASANSSFSNIKWTTASEWDFSHYEIEKSFDGLDFDFVAEVDPKGGEDLLTDYSYTDLFPGRDLVYYRLKMIDLDGSFEYSKVVSVSSKASLEELSVFPNPAPNGNFSLYYPNAFGKEIQVSVMNAVGMQVFNKTLVLDRDVLDIAPEKELQSGHYMLNVQIDGQVFRKHMIFH